MRILDVQHLQKSFGGLMAVKDLSFHVDQGEILGLIGPNGAGKTTVFNLIMGVLKPDSGTIRFKEKEITSWPTYQIVNAGVARVFQIARYFKHKNVYENIEISTIPNEVFAFKDAAHLHEKVMTCCECTGLCTCHEHTGHCNCCTQLPGMLPQGALRRLEVARAIGTDPDLLLLDEPFAGLSPQEVDEISHLITQLRQEGQTIVLIDHNMRGLMRLVDRVVVLCFGEKLMEGSPQEVSENPRVQEAYLAGGRV
ncbi:ABC transporter ATP-binding protein [Candidatus Acetothermia bacterium]|nr:ABC transporter ATP-binding protein [Candidatus Acetothermia bacterium]